MRRAPSTLALQELRAPFNKDDVATLKGLIEAGRLAPVIDRRYPLSEVPDALRCLEEGRVRGKDVITA